MSTRLVVQMNGIKITSFSVIGAESVSYRSHSLVVFQFANVLHLRKYWWSFHTSFPPIRVIYLFIFFSFTPRWSRLRAELWVKQNLRLFNLPHLTTFYCTRLFFYRSTCEISGSEDTQITTSFLSQRHFRLIICHIPSFHPHVQ